MTFGKALGWVAGVTVVVYAGTVALNTLQKRTGINLPGLGGL